MAARPMDLIDDEDDIEKISDTGSDAKKKKGVPVKEKPKKEKPPKRTPIKEKVTARHTAKKMSGEWVALIFIFTMLASLIGILGFDAFGIRTKYLNGVLQNIPIVKNLIPVENNGEDGYAGFTAEQFIDEIEKLKAAVERDQETINSLDEKNDLYVEEITRLKAFEAQQAAFKSEKEVFDRIVAANDPGAYAAFYESINPETAETLYQEAVLANQSAAQIKEYIAAFTAMDGEDAAEILQQMIPTDMQLVVMIVKALDAETKGAVLSQMTPENAASVVKMTAPENAAQ